MEERKEEFFLRLRSLTIDDSSNNLMNLPVEGSVARKTCPGSPEACGNSWLYERSPRCADGGFSQGAGLSFGVSSIDQLETNKCPYGASMGRSHTW